MSKAKTGKFKLPYLLTFGGITGFLASFVLAVEKIEIIKNPDFQPSCNINPILSCGSVMVTPQAEAFGFPNPFLGIAGFAVVSTIGIALLAGVNFKRWFWLLVQAGLLFAVIFIHWLFFQTVYRIDALCPYCMVVWIVTIPLFWYTLLYNLRQGNIKTVKSLRPIVNFAQKHHGDILIVWYLIIAGLILNHFWYYWSTLI
ncbi:MAG TPA: vitamin K epoxide reductase family protein [Patescibacteria group bacterium]|nr:vitamin K epoxide reductase family protein [Patescibacteria group bacterium]